MTTFDALAQFGHMELHAVSDEATGLRAMVAIHDTRLGPAIGGCRVFAYKNELDAILDSCRLARGMTYKAALAGLPHGGGKSVIWLDPNRPVQDREAFFRAFGTLCNGLGGRYLTCEDSGTSPEDMDVVRSVTPHVLGTSLAQGGSGDPSPFTALGVRRGVEAVADVILSRPLKGLHVAIQGVGHVGTFLARELATAGCRLTIADVNQPHVQALAKELGAQIVSVDEIVGLECDIYSPNALGGALNDATVERLRCKVVAGAANNQLAHAKVADTLVSRGIFYAPDYAINSGGLINVAQEFKGYDENASREKCMKVYDTIAEIARRSQKTGQSPALIADKMVEEILACAGTGVGVGVMPNKSSTGARQSVH